MSSDYLTECTSTILKLIAMHAMYNLGKKYITMLNSNRRIFYSREASTNRERNSNQDREINIYNLQPSSNSSDENSRNVENSINSVPDLISTRFIHHIIDSFINIIDIRLDSVKPSCLNIPDEFDESNMPDEFKCPISKSIMKDPVISADGHTYDREYIEIHLRNSRRSPLNSELLLFPHLIPNWNIRKLIQSHVSQSGSNSSQSGSNSSQSGSNSSQSGSISEPTNLHSNEDDESSVHEIHEPRLDLLTNIEISELIDSNVRELIRSIT